MNMRQTGAVACLGWGGPSRSLADLCLPPPRPSGTQLCALLILSLAPRAQALKYVGRWMDTAMQIVSSWLQNVRGNHIFPSFPSGILNTQNQVSFSVSTEVSNHFSLQVSLNSKRRRYQHLFLSYKPLNRVLHNKLFHSVFNLYQNNTIKLLPLPRWFQPRFYFFLLTLSFLLQTQEIKAEMYINNVYVTNVNTRKSENSLRGVSKSL